MVTLISCTHPSRPFTWIAAAAVWIANIGVSASPAHAAVTAQELGQLGTPTYSEQFTSTQWDRLTEIMSEDSEVHALLDDVREKLGLQSISDIQKIVRIRKDLPEQVQGQYEHSEKSFSTSSLYQADADPRVSQAQAKDALENSVASRLKKGPTVNELLVETTPTICVREGLDLFNTISTLIHELQHLRGDEFVDHEDILDYLDETDFIERTIDAPGGEMESFATQMRGVIRLSQRSGKRVVKEYEMLRYFDAQGNLIDRPGLRNYVLENLGYRERLAKEYSRSLIASYQNSQARLRYHEGPLLSHSKDRLASSQTFASSLQATVDTLRNTQPGSPRIAETQSRLLKAQSDLEKAKIALRQIDAESASLRARLRQLDAKMRNISQD